MSNSLQSLFSLVLVIGASAVQRVSIASDVNVVVLDRNASFMSPLSMRPMRAGQDGLEIGGKVGILGLKQRTDLNGKTGILEERVTDKDRAIRWRVNMDETGRIKRAKPENLVALAGVREMFISEGKNEKDADFETRVFLQQYIEWAQPESKLTQNRLISNMPSLEGTTLMKRLFKGAPADGLDFETFAKNYNDLKKPLSVVSEREQERAFQQLVKDGFEERGDLRMLIRLAASSWGQTVPPEAKMTQKLWEEAHPPNPKNPWQKSESDAIDGIFKGDGKELEFGDFAKRYVAWELRPRELPTDRESRDLPRGRFAETVGESDINSPHPGRFAFTEGESDINSPHPGRFAFTEGESDINSPHPGRFADSEGESDINNPPQWWLSGDWGPI